MRTFLKIAVFLGAAAGALLLAAPARTAMPALQKAAMTCLERGCTVKVNEGGYRIVVRPVSKSWQMNGKKCRTLRIMVFQGQDLSYNGIQKVCEP